MNQKETKKEVTENKKPYCETTANLVEDNNSNFFKLMFEQISDWVFFIEKTNFQITDVNNVVCKELNLSKDQIVSKKVTDFFGISFDSAKIEVPFLMKLQNSTTRFFEGKFNHIKNEDCEFYVLILRDITGVKNNFFSEEISCEIKIPYREQIATTKFYTPSDLVFKKIVEQLPHPLFVKDYIGNFLFVNTSFAALFGKKPSDFVYLKAEDIYPPEVIKRIQEEDNQIINNNLPITIEEHWYCEKFGKVVYFLTKKTPFLYGKQKTILGIKVDLAAQKNAELNLKNQNEAYLQVYSELKKQYTLIEKLYAEIQYSENKYKNYISNAPDAIFITDSYGNCLETNNAAVTITGYSLQELKKIPLVNLFYGNGENNIFKYFKELIEKGWANAEICYLSKYDHNLYLSLASVKIAKNEYLTFVKDISILKNTERELLKAKNMAEENDELKSAFLANMSHEVRTPLNGILGFVNLLDEECISAELKKEYIRIINMSARQLLNIISDIIDISKLEAGQMMFSNVEFSLNSFFDTLLLEAYEERENLMKEDIEIRILKGLPDGQDIVFSDENRLKQILNHLISNAIKFTKEGYVEIGYELFGSSLFMFFVKDTGVGIADYNKEIIFDRFRQIDYSETRSYGGTGLGLSLAKGITELMDGAIWLESEEGKGSIFFVKIPLVYKIGVSIKEKLLKTTFNWEGKKVMIVEDTISNFLYIEQILLPTGIKIFHAENGLKALQMLQTHSDINIILLDIQMPVMDGYETAQKIRELKKDTFIIAQTAFTMISEKQKCFDYGCNDFLAKPFVPANLLEKMSAVL